MGRSTVPSPHLGQRVGQRGRICGVLLICVWLAAEPLTLLIWQAWLEEEALLQRSLASYVGLRTTKNKNARRDSGLQAVSSEVFPNQFHVSLLVRSGQGHERMKLLKAIISARKEARR